MSKSRLIVFSGAGLSAESGISTFRDSNGLWENNKIEEICNINTWRKNKDKVFKFYDERRIQLNEVKPNSIHLFISELEKKYGVDRVINITQNVDNLLEISGCNNVIHLHGELDKMMCTKCKDSHWDIGYKSVKYGEEKCPTCKSFENVKPYIVFFGENAPNYLKLNQTLNTITKDDIILVIGTMGNVVPISSMIMDLKCTKILSNLEESPYINDKIFDNIFYKKGSEAIEEIKDIVYRKMDDN